MNESSDSDWFGKLSGLAHDPANLDTYGDAKNWVAVKRLEVSYGKKETLIFTTYP